MKQGITRELSPKRRFPEFRDAPNWIEKSLDEVLSPVLRERKKPIDAYTGLGVRSHGKGTFSKNLENPEKNSMEYLYEVERDDLIVNITFAWEGAIAIAKPTDTGALVSHRFPTYVFKTDVALPKFFRYIVLDKQFVYNLGVISPGGAGRNRVLNKNDFLKLRVFLPEVSEQQKITECLTSLDELIDAHGQKLNALETHKKGLLKELFPCKGETQPRLRFPGFTEDWKENRLDGLSDSISSGRDKTDPAGAYDLYGSTGIIGQTSSDSYKGQYILVARVGANAGMLTRALGQFGVTDNTLVISLNPTSNLDFIFYYLENLNLNRIIYGSGQPLITGGQLKSLPILLPIELERKEIATCLSHLDELIASQSQKLEALKTHRQGLMQQLFPSPAEVDG